MRRDDDLMFLPQPFPLNEPQDRGGKASAKPTSEWGMLARGKTLGKRTIVTGDISEGDAPKVAPVDIMTLQGEDEYALNLNICISPPRFFFGTLPADVQSLSTLQDNAQLAFDDNHVRVPWLFAIVEWGVGGVSNTAEVDISNGTNINLSASFLRIRSALTVDVDQGAIFNAYEIAAFVGPGLPRNQVAQRTIAREVAAGTNSDVIAIPKFAKKVSGMAFGGAGGIAFPPVIVNSTIVFYTAHHNGQTAITGGVVLTPGTQFPIPSNAMFFQILAPAAGTVMTSVVFDLAL